MLVTVLLFGPGAKEVGRSQVVVNVSGRFCTIQQLRASLVQTEPRLAGYAARARWAVNHAFASEDAQIQPGDEVALIGAVSGG